MVGARRIGRWGATCSCSCWRCRVGGGDTVSGLQRPLDLAPDYKRRGIRREMSRRRNFFVTATTSTTVGDLIDNTKRTSRRTNQ